MCPVHRRSSLIDSTAERISELVPALRGKPFPSAARLARRLGVSRGTVLKALDLLRSRGLLAFHRGQRVRIVQEEAAEAPEEARVASSERFSDHLLGDLGGGRLQLGDELPTVESFARRFGIGRNTVVTGLRRLEARGLIHKSGRRWLVGGERASNAPRLPLLPLVIVLLQPTQDSLIRLFGHEIWGRFLEVFTLEAERHGVGFVTMLVREEPQADFFAFGRDRIELEIRSLGDRYLGALFLPRHMESEGIVDWMLFMERFGKPVLYPYFKRIEKPEEWFRAHPLLVNCAYGDWGTLEERGAAACAVDELVRAGHRVIGFPNSQPEYAEWVERRHKHLVESSLRYRCPPRILRQDRVEAPVASSPAADRRELLRRGPGFLAGALRAWRGPAGSRGGGESPLLPLEYRLVQDTEVLLPLIRRDDVTAILAPNDRLARRYFIWLHHAGVKIPRDMSLLSFDNSRLLKPFPISSIDMGLTSLGYKAFHYLMGKIRYTLQPSNRLWGGSFVNHTGSIGPPRKGPVPTFESCLRQINRRIS